MFQPLNRIYFSAQLKVMTYNMHNLGVKDVPWANDDKHLKARADVIQQEDPDIIAVQEIATKKDLRSFNKKYLGGKYSTLVMFDESKRQRAGTAILAKKTVQLVESKTNRDKKCGKKPCFQRDFIETVFKMPDGFKLTLFNAHLKSMRGGILETLKIRQHEAESATQIVQGRARKDPKANILMVGDLNTKSNRNGAKIFRTLANAKDRNQVARLVDILKARGLTQPTYKFKDERNQLDYMFANANLNPFIQKVYVAGKLGEFPWKVASDHLPVVTVIETDPTKWNIAPATPTS